MIVIIGRALYWLLCAMTAPNPPIPNLPPVQPRPEPPPSPSPDNCEVCGIQPRRAGSYYCGDACQSIWLAGTNRAIPIPAAPMLPDGSAYRRTT